MLVAIQVPVCNFILLIFACVVLRKVRVFLACGQRPYKLEFSFRFVTAFCHVFFTL